MSLSPLRLRLLVASLLTVSILGALDHTIVATSLATIAGELGALQHMGWVVVGYTLASTVLLPVLGKVGDLIGPRLVFLTSLAVFLVASLACGFAQDMTQLVIARVAQGMSSAGLQLMSQTIVAHVTTPRERPKYMSIIGAAFPIAILVGPVLGGAITDYWGWPWVFWINIPFGLAALGLALFAIPHIEPGARRRFDLGGAIAFTVAFVALVLAVTWIGDPAAASAAVVAFVVSAIGFAAFFAIELRVSEPIVPAAVLRRPHDRGGRRPVGDHRHRAVLRHGVPAHVLPDGVPHERHGVGARPDRHGVRDARLEPRDRVARQPHRPLPRLPDRRHVARARRGCSRWRCCRSARRCGCRWS